MSTFAPDVLVGKRIQNRRTELWLSQGELAERIRQLGLNWSQGTLSRVELGDRPVRLTETPQVASALEMDPMALLQAVDIFQGTVTHWSARLKDLQLQRERLDADLQAAQNALDVMALFAALKTDPDTKATIGVDALTFLQVTSTIANLGTATGREHENYEQLLTLAGIELEQDLRPSEDAVHEELKRQTDTLHHPIHSNLDEDGSPLESWIKQTWADLYVQNLAKKFQDAFLGLEFSDYKAGRNPMTSRLVVMQDA